MTDVQFYHLTSTPLERVLPRLLEKSLAGGFTVLVKCASPEQAEALSAHLWTYNPDSFLPHGTKADGHAEKQPIYLTATEDNPNQATLVIVTDGCEIVPAPGIKRIFDLVDAHDPAALEAAHARLNKYRLEGRGVSCVRQTETGGWEKLGP